MARRWVCTTSLTHTPTNTPPECTSFVAWRINERLDVKFHNQYKGVNWGNANTWKNAAKETGVKVNNTPKPGCIAQTDKGGGGAGHVAWVSAVKGDEVTIEEYNYRNPEGYGTRTVKKSEFVYIHIK
jgi:surface antigen